MEYGLELLPLGGIGKDYLGELVAVDLSVFVKYSLSPPVHHALSDIIRAQQYVPYVVGVYDQAAVTAQFSGDKGFSGSHSAYYSNDRDG
jgi:hypothetical protein